MSDHDPIIAVIHEFFAPLIKLTAKLPPILAYGLAITLTILILVLLDVVIPNAVMWVIVLIALACLTAFIFIEWNARKRLELHTTTSNRVGDESTLVVTPPVDFIQLRQDELENFLQKYAIVDHEQLFGVDEILEDIHLHLLNPSGGWIISLFGEGGVGKTALAYETVKRFAIQGQFTRFAWVSAKQRYFSSADESIKEAEIHLQWADLILQIASQLNIELGYSRTSWLDDFRAGIRKLPATEKCLIVIDNLETIADANIVSFFDGPSEARIVNPHKLLVTTRKSIRQHVPLAIEIIVRGLKPQSACDFIRFLGQGNTAIAAADNADFQPILEITEGNPFLIKLVIQRFLLGHKPLTLVLQELREVKAAGLASQVKDFLYVQSLKELEQAVGVETANQIMNSFCPRTAGEQLTYEQLHKYSGITDEEIFDQARKLACDLSLIRTSGGNFDIRYSIHSLLWEFTCGNASYDK